MFTARRAFSPIKSAPQLSIGIFIGFSLASLLLIPLVARAVTDQEESHFIETSVTTKVALSETASPAVKPLSVRDMVKKEFPDALVMVRIAQAESRFNPYAKNPSSTATGVFQILSSSWRSYGCTGSRTDAAANIACARRMYDADGTTPWLASSANW